MLPYKILSILSSSVVLGRPKLCPKWGEAIHEHHPHNKYTRRVTEVIPHPKYYEPRGHNRGAYEYDFALLKVCSIINAMTLCTQFQYSIIFRNVYIILVKQVFGFFRNGLRSNLPSF